VADTGARAEWTVRDAKRLRVDGDKHHTQDALAKEAGVTGDTVSKIERRIPVSRRSAMKVFDALNKCHESGLKQSRLVVRVPVAKRRK
jgi:predicted transcriptional regulator